ncbi:MAG: PAS domain S-box protein [Daejeonella sp.]
MFQLEELLTSINDAVWSYDLLTKKYLYVNQKLAEIWGISLERILEEPDLKQQLIHPEDRELYETEFEKVFLFDKAEIEYRIVTSKEIKWVVEKIIRIGADESKPGILTGTTTDISKKKELEIKLLKSEESYRYLFSNHPNPLWIFDVKTLKFLAVNNAAITNYGYSKDEFLKMSVYDIGTNEGKERFDYHLKHFNDSFREGGYWQHKKKDGSLIWVDVSSHRLIYDGKDAEIVLATDVTGRVKAGEEVIKREKLLISLVNSHNNFLLRLDTKGYFTFVNQRLATRLGYSEEELIGSHFTMTTIPEDYKLCEKTIAECIKKPGQIVNLTHQKLSSSGERFWATWEFVAITNLDNVVVELQGVGRDITQERNQRKALELSEKNLNNLFNNTRDLIWSIDKNRILISANKVFRESMKKITGHYPVLGKKLFFKKLTPAIAENWKEYYDRALNGEEFSAIEASPLDNGEFKKVELSFNPIYDSKNEVIGASCFAHDVTERLNFEEKILNQNKILKEITALTSHEIRGPVASMLGLLSLIDRKEIIGEHNNEICDYMEKAMQQLDSVIHLIVKKSAQLND